ncbi:MAG TPA: FG-GAP-like repeat-containing protein, partial [Bacteroidales bacterium]|nr:FG-GAP-like repeat-containing protein [Bacteroidales bacterium]
MGGASYSIPLEVLPGINGLAPSLSLVYSSNSGPGIAGYGWQIAGLSAISRGPKTVYHDGKALGVELDTTDRFYLDGQRLVTTNSYAYGNANAEYQTDVDVFTRVKQYGTDAYGPGYFKAETKPGLVYEYGNTTTSKQRIFAYNQIVNWYISKVSDLFGNHVNMAYFIDRYSVYPYEITYGPNTITFYYKERSDKNASYLKHTKIEQWYILDKITIKYNTTVVKTYEFKYNYQSTLYNSHSVLNEIVEYGIGSSRLNSTAITYQVPENVTFSQAVYNTTNNYVTYKSRLFFGDFNGDGKSDAFCLPDSAKGATWVGWKLYLGQGNNDFGFASAGNFTTSINGNPRDINENHIARITTMDLNGDGKDDLILTEITPNNNTYYYYVLSNGTSVTNAMAFAATASLNIEYNKYPKLGDLDGDGLSDYIDFFGNGEWWLYSYDFNNLQNHFPQKYHSSIGTAISTSDKLIISDFNGDGRGDFWRFYADGFNIYSLNGNSFVQIFSSSSIKSNYFFTLGDFNGDGKTDIFYYGYKNGSTEYDMNSWEIHLSTGAGFEIFYLPKKKSNLKDDIVRQGDFNGDGSTDLMITAETDNGWTGHYYYISKNRGTDFYSHFKAYPSAPVPSHNYYIEDFDGDGRGEYLCTDGNSPWWNGFQIYKATGNTNILMEKIGNGLGVLTKLAYTKLSQAPVSVYQHGYADLFPVYDYQGPISVISSTQLDNGKGTMNVQNYYYEGLKIHRQGKGILCYIRTKVTDVTAGIETENTYGYSSTYFYPKNYGTYRRLTGQPNTFESVTNGWSEKVLSTAKKRIFPYMSSSSQTNSLTGHTVSFNTSFDNFGNPINITKSYNNGPTETTTHTYSNITSPLWLIGRPTGTTVEYSGGGTTITRNATRVFNSNNNNIVSETWHTGTTVGIKNEFEYNTNGTFKKQTVRDTYTNVYRSTQYTYESNFVRVRTITDPLGHITTNTYDTYGRLYTQQDYLGNTVTYVYNNLNRPTTLSTTNGNQSTTVYGWETPTSTPKPARYSVQKTGNDGSQTKSWYDKLGREIRSDVKGFDGTMIYTVTKYNTKGQVDSISDPYYSTGTSLWNRFLYDNYGRKTNLYTPSGRNSTWSYTASTVNETTAGKSFVKTFASNGTLSSATDAGGTISYTYYPDGKVKTIVAPGSITTSMQYDIAGNQTQLIDPSAGTITYLYNGFGELTNQQNARSQTTQLTYYADGRPYQKILSVEGTTTYNYNTNKQLTGISSPDTVSRIFGYDTKGRVTTTMENIKGSSFITNFTYDNIGRMFTITHPSNIVETNSYNIYGYLSSISAGGAIRWTTLNVNARGQMTRGRYGSSLEINNGYNNYGYPTFTSTGSLQNFQYDFNNITGNLNYRLNPIQGMIREDFEYDNLDRLDRVYRGSTTLLDMAYEPNKGGIRIKSDVGLGKFKYNMPNMPYALSRIDSCTLISSAMNDSLTYTSFESVKTITEGTYNATFTYNPDNERAKMVVLNGSNHVVTRWYPNSSFMKDSVIGTVKKYTYIGGDAYTAPVMAVIQNGGAPVYYYLLRDHLGSITHIVNTSNTVVAEYSYDAWGRMRNPTTWVNFAPGSEPVLTYAGRGYTGHEHLPWFKLINMNGRIYDPLTGQFLSPDN